MNWFTMIGVIVFNVSLVATAYMLGRYHAYKDSGKMLDGILKQLKEHD